MIDLTDFTQVPQEVFHPSNPKIETKSPTSEETRRRVMAPINPGLVDSEMQESLSQEARRPSDFKKTHWSINDFGGVPYNEADAARIRKERGMPEPDDMIDKSEHVL